MTRHSFLRKLPLTKDEVQKLKSLGADNALALLAMRKAFREAFDSFVGKKRAARIAAALESLLTDDERKRLAHSKPARFPLGARLRHPPRSA